MMIYYWVRPYGRPFARAGRFDLRNVSGCVRDA